MESQRLSGETEEMDGQGMTHLTCTDICKDICNVLTATYSGCHGILSVPGLAQGLT